MGSGRLHALIIAIAVAFQPQGLLRDRRYRGRLLCRIKEQGPRLDCPIGAGRWFRLEPAVTRRPARALDALHDHQIRRSRHIVQERPLPSVRWADIPELSARDRRCPPAWQQYWQRSPPDRADPQPSANEGGYIQSCRAMCESSAQSPTAVAWRRSLCCGQLSPGHNGSGSGGQQGASIDPRLVAVAVVLA